jgi:hypothetical protein
MKQTYPARQLVPGFSDVTSMRLDSIMTRRTLLASLTGLLVFACF